MKNHVQVLRISSFNLEEQLKTDNEARMVAEKVGEVFTEAEEYQFDDTLVEAVEPQSGVIRSSVESLAGEHLSRGQKKKLKRRRRERGSRAAQAAAGENSGEVKARAVENAMKATEISLDAVDAAALPVARVGWTGNSKAQLSGGLLRVWRNLDLLAGLEGFRLFNWDGMWVFCFLIKMMPLSKCFPTPAGLWW